MGLVPYPLCAKAPHRLGPFLRVWGLSPPYKRAPLPIGGPPRVLGPPSTRISPNFPELKRGGKRSNPFGVCLGKNPTRFEPHLKACGSAPQNFIPLKGATMENVPKKGATKATLHTGPKRMPNDTFNCNRASTREELKKNKVKKGEGNPNKGPKKSPEIGCPNNKKWVRIWVNNPGN